MECNYFEILFEHGRNIFVIYAYQEDGAPGKALRINPWGLDKLGYEKEEVRDIALRDLLSDNTVDDFLDAIKNHKHIQNYYCVWLTKESVFIDLVVENIPIEFEGEKAGLLIARDITELKKAEEELRFLNEEVVNQKENFQALIDNLTQTQEQLVQSEKMAALGQLIAGIAHEINTPLGAIKASVGNMNDSLQLVLNSATQILEDFTEEEMKVFVMLMRKSNVTATSNISSLEKRSIRKELAAKLSKLGVDNSLIVAEKCIYLNVHNQIDEFIDVIPSINFTKVTDRVKSYISLVKNMSTINIAIEKASKVVFALKKFIHHDHSGDMMASDINDGVETVLTLYHNQIKQGVEVVRNFGQLPLVKCYQDELNQVWTNLVHNALHAMNQKGVLTITTKHVEDEVIVSISDTGSGIEPEIQQRIFTPFFTTKKSGEGSGLGLDIVKKIIDKHMGNVSFDTEIGKGTTFHVALPVNQ